MRIRSVLTGFVGLMSLLLPETGWMAVISVPTTTDNAPCIIGALFCNTGGAAGFSDYLINYLFIGVQDVFMAAAILLFLEYGIRLMMESGEESTISEVKSAYTYAISGCAIMTLATFIVQIVGQGNGGDLVNEAVLDSTLGKVVHFMRILVGTAVTGVVAYQGMRMVILQGDEGELEKQKTRFFHSLIGVAVITLATTVVENFLPGQGSTELARQISGIANFLIVLIGGLAVLSFVVAGFMLVISTDESLKDRAKKTMFTTVIGLIILLCSYTIVNFVMLL